MSRGAAGAALGAAGATMYLRPDILIDWVRHAAASSSTLTNREIEHLSKLVSTIIMVNGRHPRVAGISKLNFKHPPIPYRSKTSLARFEDLVRSLLYAQMARMTAGSLGITH